MVRRNLMIAVLAKQRTLLNALVDQLSLDSKDENLDCLVCTRKTEVVADNLKKWVEIQRNYEESRVQRQGNRYEDRCDPAVLRGSGLKSEVLYEI